MRSAHTDAERIRVEVDSSKVTLRGSVRTYAEKIEAERTAWSAPGVTSVDNQITMKSLSREKSWMIESTIPECPSVGALARRLRHQP